MPQELTENEKRYLDQARETFIGRVWLFYFLLTALWITTIYVIITAPWAGGFMLLLSMTFSVFVSFTIGLHRKYLRIIDKLQD